MPVLKLAQSRLPTSQGARESRGPAPSRVRVHRQAAERERETQCRMSEATHLHETLHAV